MSIFRPHQTKPRQFNYIPRHYDPVKEERDRRRRELHGTSTDDDNEEYTPGRYIRTQHEARDAAKEESSRSGFVKVRNYMLLMVVVVIAILLFYPRLMSFIERADKEKRTQEETVVIMPGDSVNWERMLINETILSTEGIESINAEVLNEIQEFNNSTNIIIVDDDGNPVAR